MIILINLISQLDDVLLIFLDVFTKGLILGFKLLNIFLLLGDNLFAAGEIFLDVIKIVLEFVRLEGFVLLRFENVLELL